MANIRVFNTVNTSSHDGQHGTYKLHVDMEEIEYNVENNTSTIRISCAIIGRGYSKDGESSDGGAWYGGPSKTISVQWYDEVSGGPTQKATKVTSEAGKATDGHDGGMPTAVAEFTVQHKDDGTLKGYAKGVLTGSDSGYTPNNTSVQTALTELTTLPRGSMRLKSNGSWKRGTPYIKVNGTWKKGTAYIKTNGVWKRGV